MGRHHIHWNMSPTVTEQCARPQCQQITSVTPRSEMSMVGQMNVDVCSLDEMMTSAAIRSESVSSVVTNGSRIKWFRDVDYDSFVIKLNRYRNEKLHTAIN